MYFELTEREIELINKSLKKSQGWLQGQKEQLGGALIGFSQINDTCQNMQAIIDKLQSNKTLKLDQSFCGGCGMPLADHYQGERCGLE